MATNGRPEKPIDWKKVDELLEAGCHGTEICPHFDLSPERFYERVKQKYDVSFTIYSQEKKQKGDSCLREVQFKKALKGDNMMLVWLGKNRLNQKDSPDQNAVSTNVVAQFQAIMAQITSSQSLPDSALKIADNNINNAEKS